MIETVSRSESMTVGRFVGIAVIYAAMVTGVVIASWNAGKKSAQAQFREEAPEWVRDLPLAIQVKLKKSLQDVPDELKDAPLFIDTTPASIEKAKNPQ